MDFSEITKGPVVDFNKKAPTRPRLTREVIQRELEALPESHRMGYLVSRVDEFENLRHSYENQIAWAMAEIRRLGMLADQNNIGAIRDSVMVRHQWWAVALQKVSGIIMPSAVDTPYELEKTANDFVAELLNHVDDVRAYRLAKEKNDAQV